MDWKVSSFLAKINYDFASICKRTQFLCPKDLWPSLLKNNLIFSFKNIEDDSNKYKILIIYLAQELRSDYNKKCFRSIPDEMRKWLTDLRNQIGHPGLKDTPICDLGKLWALIYKINTFYDYTPDFLKTDTDFEI